MRKLLIEGVVIFTSIIASFWVDNYREKNEEKAILTDSIITLGNEISKNIEYTKEHIYQVKNLKYMTDVILDNFNELTLEKLKRTHDNNPFFHILISMEKQLMISNMTMMDQLPGCFEGF